MNVSIYQIKYYQTLLFNNLLFPPHPSEAMLCYDNSFSRRQSAQIFIHHFEAVCLKYIIQREPLLKQCRVKQTKMTRRRRRRRRSTSSRTGRREQTIRDHQSRCLSLTLESRSHFEEDASANKYVCHHYACPRVILFRSVQHILGAEK